MVELVDDMRLRRAQALRELQELPGRDALGAQRNHLVGIESPFDLLEHRVGQRPREIDVGRFRAEQR